MKRYLFALTGLALYAGSLGAQDYIDLEQERLEEARGREEQPAPQTTYNTEPAQTYQEVPAYTEQAPIYQESPGPQSGAAAPVASGGGQNFGEVLYQLHTLQREVMQLRGQVEEQANELRQLKQQSLERYVDLDRRLSGGAAAAPTGGNTSAETPAGSGAPTNTSPAVAQPGESDAYRAAYALVRGQKFGDAIEAFKVFLQQYPDGKYAPNAHYWLGELYLVISPADLEASRRAFTLLLEQYPDNSKVPDALYKLGRVYFQKGNSYKAREYLDRVVAEYGDSGSSAVALAKDFIAENY